MKKNDKILITGGSGLVGFALQKKLLELGYKNIHTINSKVCDLKNSKKCSYIFAKINPDYVFHLAARVYGIMGNLTHKTQSIHDNLLINTNVVEASRVNHVKKIIAMGSGCVYPYPSPRLPLNEKDIWMGEPHYSEKYYAHSKRMLLAHLEACFEEDKLPFVFIISPNLFGPNDNFDNKNGHVTPSLINKFYSSKIKTLPVEIWGNGSAKRDFLFSYDAASALIKIAKSKFIGPINIGSGKVHSIENIVKMLVKITNYKKFYWNKNITNGQELRKYNLNKLKALNFIPKYKTYEGLQITYDWYVNNINNKILRNGNG